MIDIGDRDDMHPTQKLIVAHRLAQHALARIWAIDMITAGPKPREAAANGDGDGDGDGVCVGLASGPLVDLWLPLADRF